MKYIVVPYYRVLSLSEENNDALIISIFSDNDYTALTIEERERYNRFTNLLRIKCDDIEEDFVQKGIEFTSIKEEQAKIILDKVEQWIKEGKDTIIIHCFAGVSRSPAVALALKVIFGGKIYNVSDNYQLYNRKVYRTILNEYQRRINETSNSN